MNRARFAFAATLVGASLVATAVIAQTPPPQAPPMTSVLAGKKFTPPFKGQADLDFTSPVTKNVNGMVTMLGKDGAVDTTVGQGGNIMSDLGGPNDSWYGVAVSPDKKWLYLVGFKGVATDGAGNDDAVFARAAL